MPGMMPKKRPMDAEQDDDDIVDPAPPEGEGETDEAPEEDEAPEAEEAVDEDEPSGQGMAPPAAGAPAGVEAKFVDNGLKLMYNEQSLPALIQALEGGGNPVEGLANTLATIVMQLMTSAEKSGIEIPVETMLKGAGQLLEKLANLSAQSDGHKYTPEEKQLVVRAMMESVGGGEGEQPPPEQEQGQMPMRRGMMPPSA